MPEVPEQQSPSQEEVKMAKKSQVPQPSEADLDKQTAQQQPEQLSQQTPTEGENVVPVEPVEGLEDPDSDSPNEPQYEEGFTVNFTSPAGESYSITVTKVEGDQITLQNSTPGAAASTVSLEQAKEILESPTRTK